MPNQDCLHCGETANPEAAKFCIRCGNVLGPLTCDSCGQTGHPSNAKFCHVCGWALIDKQDKSSPPDSPEEKISTKPARNKTVSFGELPRPTKKTAEIPNNQPSLALIFFKLFLVVVLIAGVWFFPSFYNWFFSPKHNTTDDDNKIVVGTRVDLGKHQVGSSGGQLKFQNPSGPLDGLTIEIPQNAFPSAREVQVGYASIQDQFFGRHVNPISPLIEIDAGNDLPQFPLRVSIPLRIPPEHFAMAFYLTDEGKTLEAIPATALSLDRISIVTRRLTHFFISSIPENQLLEEIKRGAIDSRFRPGVDDWAFPNYGSAISPYGHCTGQSLSMAWYYDNKRNLEKEAPLREVSDNNANLKTTNSSLSASPDFPVDDSVGWRLCSSIQMDSKWDEKIDFFFQSQRGLNHRQTWFSFSYAMLVTKRPQYLGIRNGAGSQIVVAYKILHNQILVSDPNYPKEERSIPFDGINLQIYVSKPNARGDAMEYPDMGFLGRTALFDSNIVARRWAEAKAGMVGNDRFPSYGLFFKDNVNSQLPLLEDQNTEQESMHISARSTDGKIELPLHFYQWTEKEIVPAKNPILLANGINLIGIYVTQIIAGNEEYVDFRWIRVRRGEVVSLPSDNLVWNTYFDNFNKSWVKCQVDRKSRRKNGQYLEYFDDKHTNLKLKGYYINEVRVGEFTEYNDKMALISRTHYDEQGLLHGLCESNNPDGSPAKIEPYEHGKLQGTRREFYPGTQQVKFECEYKNGEKNGLEINYHLNNVKASECTWKNGKKDGIETLRDNSNNLEYQILYKDGKVIRKSEWRKELK